MLVSRFALCSFIVSVKFFSYAVLIASPASHTWTRLDSPVHPTLRQMYDLQ